MSKDKALLIAKFIFLSLIFCTLVLGFRVSQNINISTDLGELNPQQQHSEKTRAAIAELSESIERRVLLLITAPDEDEVLDASDLISNEIGALYGIRLHPDAESLATDLLKALTPYRFALLNESQRQMLAETDDDSIVLAAKTELYTLANIRLLPFNQDPLGWHSTFIQELFSSLQPAQPDSNLFHSVVSFSIEDGAMDMQRQESLLAELNSIINDAHSEYSVSIERSGVFFFAVDAATKSKQDISLITTGSTIGVVLLLLLVFRSFWSLLLPVSSILLGVTFAFFVSHFVYGNVHILTIVFGASLIGIVVDYSLHYFYHVSAASSSKAKTNSALYRALALSLLTSLIGYSSLGLSDLPALQKVAVFSCCGLLMAWLSVICIGSLNSHKHFKLDQIILPKIQQAIAAKTQALSKNGWLLFSLLLIVSAIIVSQLRPTFNDDPRVFFNASEQLLESERAVAAIANDYEPGRYLVIQGDSEAELFAHTEQLFSILENNSQINTSNLSALLNWVPTLLQQQQDYLLQQRLYKPNGIVQSLISEIGADSQLSSELAHEYAAAKDLYVAPSSIADLLGQSTPPLLINDDGLLTSFILINKGTDTQAIATIAEQLNGVEFINSLQRTQDALQLQRYSASKLLVFAYLLIALLLLIRYRALSSAAMLLVPLTASAFVVLVCVGLGQTLNLFHIMALFLVLGFGMDYTIFTREINDMRSITLQAILLSAFTSILSFGLLSISSIPVAYSFGITLLIGNCFNLLGVFVYSHCIARTTQRISNA